jgi:hypothetical protein
MESLSRLAFRPLIIKDGQSKEQFCASFVRDRPQGVACDSLRLWTTRQPLRHDAMRTRVSAQLIESPIPLVQIETLNYPDLRENRFWHQPCRGQLM